jgi:glycerophosphoryl diester phosphodiesterase
MTRLFAHRGFASKNIPQNSIASLKRAHEFGFRAVEFDVWFLQKKLILKHDHPTEKEINILPNFRDYFFFGNEFNYWIDFKNLDEKNSENFLKAVKKTLDEAAINLDQIYFAPFITDYKIAERIFIKIRKIFGEKINLIAVCEELKTAADVKILREFLTKNKIKFLSIFHEIIDQDFVKKFSDIEIFAWTVNDLKRLRELESLGVRNFATDKIIPFNLNSMSC